MLWSTSLPSSHHVFGKWCSLVAERGFFGHTAWLLILPHHLQIMGLVTPGSACWIPAGFLRQEISLQHIWGNNLYQVLRAVPSCSDHCPHPSPSSWSLLLLWRSTVTAFAWTSKFPINLPSLTTLFPMSALHFAWIISLTPSWLRLSLFHSCAPFLLLLLLTNSSPRFSSSLFSWSFKLNPYPS